jgi:hypothetical protein
MGRRKFSAPRTNDVLRAKDSPCGHSVNITRGRAICEVNAKFRNRFSASDVIEEIQFQGKGNQRESNVSDESKIIGKKGRKQGTRMKIWTTN